jgi:hypothetical protein
MQLDPKQIETAFGFRPRNWEQELEKRLQAGWVPRPGDRSLTALGYPELFRITIFLTAAGLDLWSRERSVVFPQVCCVCGRAAHSNRQVDGLSIPYCTDHEHGRVQLMVESGSLAPKAVWVTITGLNEDFLATTEALNQSGDVFPPWEVYPQYDSHSGFWKQGGQFWLVRVFGPFWRSLDDPARAGYLARWNAPHDWRDWLTSDFSHDANRAPGN